LNKNYFPQLVQILWVLVIKIKYQANLPKLLVFTQIQYLISLILLLYVYQKKKKPENVNLITTFIFKILQWLPICSNLPLGMKDVFHCLLGMLPSQPLGISSLGGLSWQKRTASSKVMPPFWSSPHTQ
jgi:hypothetical protein